MTNTILLLIAYLLPAKPLNTQRHALDDGLLICPTLFVSAAPVQAFHVGSEEPPFVLLEPQSGLLLVLLPLCQAHELSEAPRKRKILQVRA